MPDNITKPDICNTFYQNISFVSTKYRGREREREWDRKRLVRNKLSQETQRNPIRNKAGTSYVNSLLNIIDKVGPLL